MAGSKWVGVGALLSLLGVAVVVAGALSWNYDVQALGGLLLVLGLLALIWGGWLRLLS